MLYRRCQRSTDSLMERQGLQPEPPLSPLDSSRRVCFSRLPRRRMSSPLLLSVTWRREAVRQRVINASLSPASVERDTCVVPRGPTVLIGATASHKLEGRVRVWRTESTALAFRGEFHAEWTSQSLGSTDDYSQEVTTAQTSSQSLGSLTACVIDR